MPPSDISNPEKVRPVFRTAAKNLPADDTNRLRLSVSSVSGGAVRAKPTRHDGSAETTQSAHGNQGPISGGGRHASGGGHSDGSALREARSRGDHDGPRFDLKVDADGYAWWYIDGISADGSRAVSVIAFIGSVFSPWYRWSGRRDPHNNVCINVATYGPGGRFTMTDRGRGALRQTENQFTVGPSSLRWTGTQLVIEIDEMGALPLLGRVKGTITLTPSAVTGVELDLTPDGAHQWRPFAPVAEIKVDLNGKGWQWDGHGYFDANFGTRSLEADFDFWTWGRYPTGDGALCHYDAVRRDQSQLGTAISFDRNGNATQITPPPKAKMRRSLWAVSRDTRADAGYQPRQVKSMLEAPFYTRSMVRTKLDGKETVGVHEALDMRRYRWPLLMPMIAVRVPRRRGWTFKND